MSRHVRRHALRRRPASFGGSHRAVSTSLLGEIFLVSGVCGMIALVILHVAGLF